MKLPELKLIILVMLYLIYSPGHEKYRLLYGRGVPLGHIGTGVAISAQGPWIFSAIRHRGTPRQYHNLFITSPLTLLPF